MIAPVEPHRYKLEPLPARQREFDDFAYRNEPNADRNASDSVFRHPMTLVVSSVVVGLIAGYLVKRRGA